MESNTMNFGVSEEFNVFEICQDCCMYQRLCFLGRWVPLWSLSPAGCASPVLIPSGESLVYSSFEAAVDKSALDIPEHVFTGV